MARGNVTGILNGKSGEWDRPSKLLTPLKEFLLGDVQDSLLDVFRYRVRATDRFVGLQSLQFAITQDNEEKDTLAREHRWQLLHDLFDAIRNDWVVFCYGHLKPDHLIVLGREREGINSLESRTLWTKVNIPYGPVARQV